MLLSTERRFELPATRPDLRYNVEPVFVQSISEDNILVYRVSCTPSNLLVDDLGLLNTLVEDATDTL